MTYADTLRPSTGQYARFYDLACVVGGSIIIALSAQVSVPLPFSPVPITGQTLAVLLVGSLLGRTRGTLSVLLYLAQGISGLPVFAGGMAGMIHLAGPTGGYLVGFVPAAFLTGFLADCGWDRRVGSALLAMLVGNMAMYACGLPWLARFVGPQGVLALGLAPFIPGDLLKLAVAATLLPSGWKVLRWSRGS